MKLRHIWEYVSGAGSNFLEQHELQNELHKGIENNRSNKINATIAISFERSRYYFHFREHVILAVIYVVVIFMSIIINNLIILIVPFRKKFPTPMDLMLVNLCLSHLVSSLFVIAYVSTLDVGDIASEKTWSLTCAFTETLQGVLIAVGVSVSMLCMICYNRFVAVVYPQKRHLLMKKHHVIVANILLWVCCICGMIPLILSQQYYPELCICHQDLNRIRVNVEVFRWLLSITNVVLPRKFYLRTSLVLPIGGLLLLSYYAAIQWTLK